MYSTTKKIMRVYHEPIQYKNVCLQYILHDVSIDIWT